MEVLHALGLRSGIRVGVWCGACLVEGALRTLVKAFAVVRGASGGCTGIMGRIEVLGECVRPFVAVALTTSDGLRPPLVARLALGSWIDGWLPWILIEARARQRSLILR